MWRFPIIILILICIQPQCKKEKECCPTQLPAISETGKNVFGCKVNGEVWVPFYKCALFQNPCGEMFIDILKNDGVEINIALQQKEQDNSTSNFLITSPTGTKIYTTGNKTDSLRIAYSRGGSLLPYYNSNINNRIEHFTITRLDTLNKIISGIFELTLYKSFSDSVNVTEGRFDFKYNYCRCTQNY